MARCSILAGETDDHTLSRRGGGRQDSDGGLRQAGVYRYVGELEKDRHGCDETLRSGSRSHRARKEVWGWEMREVPRGLLLNIPLCEVLNSGYREELNLTELIALTCSKCSSAVTGCRLVSSIDAFT